MKPIIYRYLSLNYHINNHCIQPNGIIKDLNLVFGLTKKQLKYYIKGWVRKQNPALSFNKCWDRIDDFFLYGKISSRRLRAEWTPEMAVDLMGYHSIDAEAELSAMLTQQLINDINREIMINLREMAIQIP